MKNSITAKPTEITVHDTLRRLIFYVSVAFFLWVFFQIIMFYSGSSLVPLDVIFSFFVNYNLLLMLIAPLLLVYSIINLFLKDEIYKWKLFAINLASFLLVFHHVWLPYFGVSV